MARRLSAVEFSPGRRLLANARLRRVRRRAARRAGPPPAFSQGIRTKGQYVAGEALHPSTTATTVRVRNGKTTTTDGPFAETKEQLGGFYIIDAADLNDALQIAARIPEATSGSIEVRPVMDFSQQS